MAPNRLLQLRYLSYKLPVRQIRNLHLQNARLSVLRNTSIAGCPATAQERCFASTSLLSDSAKSSASTSGNTTAIVAGGALVAVAVALYWMLKSAPAGATTASASANATAEGSNSQPAAPVAMPARGVLITGPSGVGKGTLIKLLMDQYPDTFGFSVSHTTRGARKGEEDGVHYHFVSHEEFQKMLAEDAFVEHAQVVGNYYGTSKKAVEDVNKAGKVCILDIDVKGAKQVHAAKLNFYKIFILPPNRETLRQRLQGRGTESPDKIEMRVNNAIQELDFASKNEGGVFDEFIVNEDLQRAFAELKAALNKGLQGQVQLQSTASP